MVDMRSSIVSSVISPHDALEALALADLDRDDSGPSTGAHGLGFAIDTSAGIGRGQHSQSALAASEFSQSESHTQTHAPPEFEHVPEFDIYRVRALYDFDATDESALSFRAGDIIEVLTMLPSGWWDGMLGAHRGWFPSNYVEDFDDATKYSGKGLTGGINGVDGGYDGDIRSKGRERDVYEYETLEIGPDGQVIGHDDDVLGIDESLERGWGEMGGIGELGSSSLDNLAYEVLTGAGPANSRHERDRPGVNSRSDRGSGSQGRGDEFADTARRMRQGRPALDLDEFGVHHVDEAETTMRAKPTTGNGGGDFWVPSLTVDGRVYYHNMQSGEDSWEIPEGDNDTYGHDAKHGETEARDHTDDFIAAPSMRGERAPEDSFGTPPSRALGDVPYPWVARLSDDGREWFYHNQLTGGTRRDPPVASARAEGVRSAIEDGLRRASGSSQTNHTRESVQARRAALDDWEAHMREVLTPLYKSAEAPTMGGLVEAVNEAVREVFEAAVAGSAAEEELSRARDLQSATGIAAAVLRDESAVDLIRSAHIGVVNAVRDLVSAFGYVGPLTPDPAASVFDNDVTRPRWTNDMSLVGSLGLLAISTHAVVIGRRVSESGLSVWAEVMRSASKLRDVVCSFPALALDNVSQNERDDIPGHPLIAWFGADALGDFMSGKYGFGSLSTRQTLRPLAQAVVLDMQKLRVEVDAAMRTAAPSPEGTLDILRVASYFSDAVAQVDVAVAIDLDGDLTAPSGPDDQVRDDDSRAYIQLVAEARRALRDLDAAALMFNGATADMFLRPDARGTREALTYAVTSVSRALSALLFVAEEQAAAVEQGIVRGSLGQRSAAHAARRAAAAASDRARSQSLASSESQRSLAARGNGSAGFEEEVLQPEAKTSSIRQQRPTMSKSASQSSLSNLAFRREASSSTTSLAYQQESDSGSIRGSNRSSILKAVPGFLRNRSASDLDDGRGSKSKAGSKKLAKLLGEDVFASHTTTPPSSTVIYGSASATTSYASVPTPGPQSAPWYLGADYPPADIVFDDKGNVKAGTIRSLIERLTPHTSADTAFFQAFLLTYRSFVSTDDLVQLLIERYNIPPPPELDPDQLREWHLRKQTPIRLRVANTFKAWLDHHYMEKQDRKALDAVEAFAKTTLVANGSELLSKQLVQLVERRRRGDGDAHSRRIVTGGLLSPPAPILPRSTGRPMQVLDIQPLELARQLTILESTYYQRIRPAECLNKAWQREDAAEIAPNVGYVIFTANRLAGWVALLVLRTRDVKQRATILKHLIRMATELRTLNNFSSMAAVVAGLSSSPISRLKRTWEQLSEKNLREWAALERTMDSTKNFQKYKEMLKTINPPCVPFLGFYLSALVFIEDGNKDMVQAPQPGAPGSALPSSSSSSSLSRGMLLPSTPAKSDASGVGAAPSGQLLINFFKRSLSAEILRDIQQYQSQPYNLATCKPIYRFIESGLEAVAKESEDLYDISCAIEPKEKEDDRVARMLHDSSFIKLADVAGLQFMS